MREAIRILVAYGALEIQRGKGTYVTETALEHTGSFEQLSDAKVNAKYEMRLIFEPEAAYLAAIRGSDSEIKRIIELGTTLTGKSRNWIPAARNSQRRLPIYPLKPFHNSRLICCPAIWTIGRISVLRIREKPLTA